jgi:phosphatidylglycerophosphatase A
MQETNIKIKVTTDAPQINEAQKRTWRDYLALAVATCGVGFIKFAPGTWGSAVGVGIYLFLNWTSVNAFAFATSRGWSLQTLESIRVTFMLVLVIVLTLIGIKAATRVEKVLKRKDPGAVVIDEVVGQLITFLLLPLNAAWWTIVTGFFIFRFFDIVKPYPCRRLEALESGLGIMADDVLAGVYAAATLSLLTSIHLLFF